MTILHDQNIGIDGGGDRPGIKITLDILPMKPADEAVNSNTKKLQHIPCAPLLPAIRNNNNCIHEIIQGRAHSQPEAVAICAWDGQFTYAELERLSNSFAAQLAHHGVGPEVYVPVCAEKSRWVPVAILGILKAGGAFVLLDPSHPIARLRDMCNVIDATRVVASNQTASIASQLASEVFIIDAYDARQPAPKPAEVNPSHVAYAIFTSGSTGRPKAVAIEHRAFCSSAIAHAEAINMSSKSRVLQFASYAFDLCLTEMLTTLIVGACVCIPSDEGRISDLRGEAHRLSPNFAILTPSLARVIDPADLPMLQTLGLGGEAIDEDDVRKWAPHLDLFVAYGVSEASVINLVRRLSINDTDHIDASNLGFGTGVACWIVNPDDHNRLEEAGNVGELVLDGPVIGRGYINDITKTAEAFIDPPCWYKYPSDTITKGVKLYKTGDLCSRDPMDGSIRYIGRKDNQKKFRGQRLEVAEVEYNLRKLLPDARHLVVDVVNVEDLETLIAFILPTTQLVSEHVGTQEPQLLKPAWDFSTQTQTAQQQLRKIMPEWMVPSVFLPISYMPLMPSGKSDRRKLRSMATTLTQRQLQSYGTTQVTRAKRAPSTLMEKAVQKLWASVLLIPDSDIGLDDNFVELGGTSIHAMKLSAAARRQQLTLPVRDVFRRGSLEEMAASLSSASLEAVTPISPFSLIAQTEDRESLIDRAVQICQLQDRHDIEDIYPSTPLQEGLISLTATRPGAYAVSFEYKLPVDLDIHRFQRAWDMMVDMNPILRTRFIQSVTGAMYQVVVRKTLPLKLETDIESTFTETNIWNAWGVGKDLTRFSLRRLDHQDSCHVFVFAIHHALSDGWAMPLLLQQVQAAYDGASNIPYRPFNNFISYISESKTGAENFWKEYFVDLHAAAFPSMPPTTHAPNPAARKTFTIQVDSPGGHEFSVPNRLKLAWGILISLYTESPDTIFGLTVAGRGASSVLGIDEMTGPTISTIPYRLKLQLDGTIGDALRQVQEDSVAMIPFEQAGLQYISRLTAEATSACAFQSILVIQPEAGTTPTLFRNSRDLSALDAFSTYAINLICRQMAGGSIEIDATWDPKLIDGAQFDRMLHLWRHLFGQLNPSQSAQIIRDMDVISTEDWAELSAWNGALPSPVTACAHDLIREQSELRPNAPAVCAWDGSFTFAEIEKMSSSLAAYLMEQGVGPEVFIPLCFEKSRWTTVSILGVIKAGGAFILLDPSHPAQRLRSIYNDSKAPFVIASESNRLLASEFATRSVIIGSDWKPWESPTTLLSVPNPLVSPENSMYAVFTSGSTGTPKGATHSHISWCTSAQANRVSLYLEPSSRVLQFAAYAFDVSIADNLLTLLAGGCVCVPKNADIKDGNIAKVINDLDANWAAVTPSLARILDPTKVPSLRYLALVGEPIASEVISQWSSHVHILNLYGPAECAILTTAHRNVRNHRDPNNVGFPTSAVCWVVDPLNQNRLLPIGTVGELVVESPIVGHGYLNDPERSAESFIPADKRPSWLSKFRPSGTCRLYRTGDLVQYTEHGALRYVGRMGTQIKLRGQRIELGEVEYYLGKAFPGAEETVAEVIVKKGGTGSALTAFVLPKRQVFKISDRRFQALASEAASQLELILPPYMVPTVFIPVDQFPYSKSGKLDRKLLRTLAAELPSDEYTKQAETVMAMPVSDEEQVLHELFAQVLSIPTTNLSIADNFMKLGGDSILAMRLVTLAKERGLLISTADVLRNPTISSLAQKAQKYHDSVQHQVERLSLLPKNDAKRHQIEIDAANLCQISPNSIEDIYPCTPIQEGLLALSTKTPGMYIARFEYEIPHTTDLIRYQDAWNQVLNANSILRTRIIQSSGDDGLFQVVVRSAPGLEVYQTVEEQQYHSNAKAMTLGSPLVHLSLAPLAKGSESYRFLLTIHHSLYDGQSLVLIWQQFLQAYKGQALLAQPFNRFIHQMVQITGGEEFWTSQMGNLNAVQFPPLPQVDYSPDPSQSLYHSITDLPTSKGEHTLSTMIQFALAVMLSHYTDSNDVVFGLTSDGRSAAVEEIASVTGPTIATVPVRVSLNLDHTVEASLSALQQQTVAMIPFLQSGLQRIRRINKDTARACEFQTQLVIQPPGIMSGADLEGLATAKEVNFKDYKDFASYAFVLLCHMKEGSNNLDITVNYDSNVLPKQEVQRMVEQFHGALRQILVKRSSRIREIEVISKEDINQLAVWNAQLPCAAQETLHELVLQHSLKQPEADAVSGWDGSITYRELDGFSKRLAQHLLALGVQSESKVAVCLEKSSWSIVVFMAILRSGCACVMIDPGHPRDRIESIISRAAPELVLVSGTHKDLTRGFVDREVPISSEFIRSLPSLPIELPTVAVSQAAFILFTSGSTGTPKGIVMEHANLSASVTHAGPTMNFNIESRSLHFSSYAFDASIYEIFNTLAFGGCLCVVSEHDRMNNLASVIRDQHINLAIFTPSTIALLEPADVPSLKTVILGGEALTYDIANRWADKVRLINGYGPAEATICCTTPVTRAWRLGTIGHMVGGHGWIVDKSNHTKLAAIGVIGELLIEGAVVTRGYLNEPELTSQAYLETPHWLTAFRSKSTESRLYKTGDLVQYNHDGTLRFIGRKGLQVKLRGQRIELGEVEYHVKKYFPVITDVVADIITPTDGGRMPFLASFILVGEQAADSTEDLSAEDIFYGPTRSFREMAQKTKAKVSSSVPSYMVPEVFLPLRRVPLSRSGKLDRRQLREACISLSPNQIQEYSTETGVAKRGPSTDIERTLQQIWARVLNLETDSIGVDDSWVKLGGDSIQAMRVVAQCAAEGLRTSVIALFQEKTIAGMSLRTEYRHYSPVQAKEQLNVLFELSPIQQMFFDTAGSHYSHFNQSVSFRLSESLPSDVIQRAIRWIVENHSMFRARFSQTLNGSWKQRITNETNQSYLYRESRSETRDDAAALFLSDQRDLNIQQGPLFICHLFHVNQDKYLAFTAHHLVVDIISWQIILSDIELLLRRKTPVPPSLPFSIWAQLQSKYAAENLHPDKTSVDHIPRTPKGYWQFESSNTNRWADVAEDTFVLTERDTQVLLGSANDAFRTQPVEILHAVLLQAFAQVFPDRSVPTVFNEGHGREPWDPNIDPSRTVGWFTTLWPAAVSVRPDDNLLDIVRRTKDARRRVRNNGWAYFTSRYHHSEGNAQFQADGPLEILFNYNPGFTESTESLLQQFPLASGELSQIAPGMSRFSLIDVFAEVRDSRLSFNFIYNRHMRHQQTSISDWVGRVRHCLEAAPTTLTLQKQTFTISDFPLLNYSYSELERFSERIASPLAAASLEIEDAFKCSTIQDSILLAQAKAPGKYMDRFSWSVRSSDGCQVYPDRLQQAWHKVLQRHPLLRAVLYASPSRNGQHDQVVLKWPVIDMSVILPTSTDPVKELESYRFNMSPLSPQHRLAICASVTGNVECLLEINHAIIDGYSAPLILRDLGLAYENSLDLTPQRAYRDYVEYSHAHSKDSIVAYWQEYLKHAESCVLPPSKIHSTDDGAGTFNFALPYSQALHDFGSQHELTLANILQFTWALVLRVYLNSQSACFGYMTSARDAPITGIDDAVGAILNMNICCIQLRADESILSLLHKNQADYVQSLMHQHISIADKMKAAGGSGSTLFNTIMSVQAETRRAGTESAIVFENLQGTINTEYDIVLNVGATENEIDVAFEYSLASISDEQINNMADTFQQTLLSIISRPDQLVKDVNMLGPLSRDRVEQYNENEPLPMDTFIDELIESRCLSQPSKIAVEAWDGNLTYQQVRELSDVVATELDSRNVGSGKLVPLFFEKSCWTVPALLGVLKAGGGFVLLDTSHPADRLREICVDAGASIVLSSRQNYELASQLSPEVLVIDEQITTWEKRSRSPNYHTRKPTDMAYAIFTSGSTGKPKGAMVSHRALSTTVFSQREVVLLENDARVLQFASHAFDVAVWDNLTSLIMGACICIPSDIQRQDIAKSVADFSANWVLITPSMARVLNPSDFKTLRTVVLGGESVTEKELNAWRTHVNLVLVYGPSECAVLTATVLVTDKMTDNRILGQCRGCSGWITSPDDINQLLPVGAVGELIIEGPIVGLGYLNNAEKTKATFVEPPLWLTELRGKNTGPLYKTGDLVRYTDNGAILFVGRKDLQVKLRGNRIELGEVESRLRLSFPHLRDAVVEVVTPEGHGRQPMLVAFVYQDESRIQLEEAAQPENATEILFRQPSKEFSTQAQLAEALISKSLPAYMIPVIYLPLRYLPLTGNGKLDRRRLRAAAALLPPEQLEQYDVSTGPSQMPATTDEIMLQQIWARVLSKNPASIGLHNNFFRMGADSISAMQVVSECRAAGVKLTVADIFRCKTISQLSTIIRKPVSSNHLSDVDMTEAQSERSSIQQVDSRAMPILSVISPFTLLGDNVHTESLIEVAMAQCNLPKEEISDLYPTTPLQDGLIALAAKCPGQYIATFEYELADGIDTDRFVAAWDTTMTANPILRTRVIQTDTGFLQAVTRDCVPWQTFDDEKSYKTHVQGIRMGLGDHLVHFALIRPTTETQMNPGFRLTLHHALYDGASLSNLWGQVWSSYNGNVLPPQPFNRFIEHIRPSETASDFWKSEFDGLSAPIFPALPSSDYNPNPSSSMTCTILGVGRQSGDYTTSTAIRLAWAIIVSCYTDSEDVVYGLTVNGRNSPIENVEKLTGPTIATFPVRTQIHRNHTVRDALESIQEKTIAAIPFHHFGIQNIRRLSEEATSACSFQSHLGIQSRGGGASGNHLVTDIRTEQGDYGNFASYALVVVCHLPENGENDLVVSVSYDEDVVELLEVRRMIHQFGHVLRQIELAQCLPESQSMQVGDLDLMSPEDKAQLATWNSVVPPSYDSCVHELVLQHARGRPNAPAISAWDGEMTFQDLDSASAILSQQLLSLGVKTGSLVPLLFDRSKWVVVAMMALHRIGAACVNIDPTHPRGRIQEILNRTGAKFALSSPTHQKSMAFEGTTLVSVPIQDEQPHAEDFPMPHVSPSAIAFVIFTSGSTGKPKGILMQHNNLATSIRGYSAETHLNQNTRGLHFASYAFDASIYEIFGVLVNGGCLCIPNEFDRMNNLASAINRHSVNWAIFTPSYLSLLEPDAIPTVRTILLGGEPVTRENVDTWASRVTLVTGYGPAEATICAVGPLSASGWKQGNLGHVAGGVGWVTLPSDRSRLAPIGTPGELVIEGAVVTQGYLGDPEKTTAAYATNPAWIRPFREGCAEPRVYYSGDLVQYNADGTLRFLGRADTQIKLRGQRIELGEVEYHVRRAFPSATDVIAEVVRPEEGAPVLVAFVADAASQGSDGQGSDGQGSDTADKPFNTPSQDFLAQTGIATRQLSAVLPGFMVPAAFIQLHEIPHTTSGKADRRLLREQAAGLSLRDMEAFSCAQTTKREPATDAEWTLQSLWAQALKMPASDVGADDSFLKIGDSIAAIRLSGAARQRGLHLPVSRIFQYPVLSDQARAMTALASTPAAEYKPGSMLGITNIATFFDQNAADRVSAYTSHDVEDILPTTELQSTLLESKNVTYSRLFVKTNVDLARLETACRALVRKHSLLRTVFIPYGGEIIQVVLRDVSFEMKHLQCDESLLEYSERLCSQDYSSPVPFGTLHFQPTLISRSDTDHVIVIRMTHAQYDGGSFPIISKDLAAAYEGGRLEPNASSFAHFLRYRQSQDSDDVHKFWREYLDGAEMTSDGMLGLAPSSDTRTEVLHKCLRKISLPACPDGITMGSLTKAAWSIVLARAAKRWDVVFGHIINGRDNPLESAESISGPCITISPFRVCAQAEWTVMDLLNHVQNQYTKSMPYANVDFKSIRKNATSWSLDTDFGSVFTHQDRNLDLSGSINDAAESQWDHIDLSLHTHFHAVTFPRGDQLLIHLAISGRRMHLKDVNDLTDHFSNLIEQFSNDVSQPLKSFLGDMPDV
ncbi:putative nonribosomal peptide synthase [Rosellinia necatrix]|uniref:Putative nonribosomal peptide synthase n=1 Tax=Rosellinia necatrix TaxID=77044 RepID=A0A1S7ULJ4_ROSNE|nr:putative nonribosomal peptide synthase [Rosellinia necatrix]